MVERVSRQETTLGGPQGAFLTTRWTLVEEGDAEEILKRYWRPVYLHLRRRGHAIEEAKDLTQDFFLTFLEKDYAAQADRSRGRFRSFLKTAVDHFAADARDRARALKRGGGRIMQLDVEAAEALLSTDESPERLFDRQWARMMLDEAMAELAREYAARGQAEAFAKMRPALGGGSVDDRVALHRARHRFRELLRARIARTVESADQVDEELAELYESL